MPSEGGGELSFIPQHRNVKASDITVPEGYRIEVVTTGLTYPTGIAFDEAGTAYVIEAGYSYGEVFLEPRLIRIGMDGSHHVIYEGDKNGPWNGITYNNGYFYIAEGGELKGGKILKISKTGAVETLVEDLPSYGDHHTNGPVIKDGYVYFGQGTATNSGIVGTDNADYGWLSRKENFHDIPCQDITVQPLNKKTDNVLTADPDDVAVTGPFSPYGQTVDSIQVIEGAIPCSGAVMRVPVNGGELELVAWGFRNPYGMAMSPNGEIYITQNSYDVRGSRPIWGTGDLLWKLEEGSWYGWPDYNGKSPVTALDVPGNDDPELVLAKHPGIPPEPIARFAVHSSSNGISFSHNEEFGFKGEAFVAQFGDMAPVVGKVLSPVGYKVVRVDVESGIVEDFVLNSTKKNGPASWLASGGLERPVSVGFNPVGDALYIVDFGIMTIDKETGVHSIKQTGVVWKVVKKK